MEVTSRKGLRGRFWTLFAALAVGLVVFPASALADVTGFGGGAYGVFADVTTPGPVVVTVGPVPMVTAPPGPAGGTATADLVSADPTLVALGISVAGGATLADVGSTSGLFGTHAGFVSSSTDLAAVTVGGALSTLLTSFVSADAVSSTCTANGDTVSGSTSIVNGLAIIDAGLLNGTAALAAAPAPNTVVALTINNPLDPLGSAIVIGSVTLNQQTTVEVIGENTITVNAIHITLLAVPSIGLLSADIIIGQSRCSVTGPDVNVTPSAVQLRSFRASQSKKGVLLRWKTAQEVDSLGFNIYRQVGAKRVKVNRSLISSKGASAGHSYSFLDRSLKKSQRAKVRYWLQEVELDGSRSWLASARPFRL